MRSRRSRLARLAEDDAHAETFGVHDVLDALLEFSSARPRVGDFAAALGRMQPRLYSIASSQRKHPGEAHLTVGVLRYERNDRTYQVNRLELSRRAPAPGAPALDICTARARVPLPADWRRR
jgi:sulfite reductase (NADPH) flavoprotein alpha-component